jgi:hypothetical protein
MLSSEYIFERSVEKRNPPLRETNLDLAWICRNAAMPLGAARCRVPLAAWWRQLLNVSCLSPRISSQRKKKGFDVGYCVEFDTEGWAAQSAHRTGLRYVPIVRSTMSVCYSYAILPKKEKNE